MTTHSPATKERPVGRAAADERDAGCRFIEALVAGALGVSIADLRSTARGGASTAFARQMAMYLAHVDLGLSLSRVGRHFHRDRTTVGHACARIEDSREAPATDRLVNCLEAAVARWRAEFSEGARR